MATSGTLTSYVYQTGSVTNEGNSFAGAHYSFEWTSSKKSPGVTTVSWNLYSRGRYSSPTQLWHNVYVDTIVNGTTTRIYTGEFGKSGCTAAQYSFKDVLRTSGSFDVTHGSDGAGSFQVYFKFAAYYYTSYYYNTETATLDTNYGTAVLTLDKNGGTGGGTQTVNIGQATAISTSITASRSGYKFLGWNTATDGSGDNYQPGDNITLTGAKTLYANWSNYYTVSYSGNGATSGSVANTSHNNKESSALSSSTFTRQYAISFNGNGGTADTSSMTATYIHAGWSYNGTNYSLGQNVTGLTSTANGTVTMSARWTGGTITLPGASRSGYRLLGWSTNSNATQASYRAGDSYAPTATTTLYAVWATLPSSIKRIIYIKVNGQWKLANPS